MSLHSSPPPITDSLTDGIGLTPMVRIGTHSNVEVLAKLEYSNPTGSVKDRVAKHLLEEYERRTHVEGSSTRVKILIIPTTGNLGISLATFAARHRYHRVICIVPERTSNDRIALLKALGVEIIRSPNEAHPEAPESATSVAARLADQLSASSTNVAILDETTFIQGAFDDLAEELIQQTHGQLDYLFVGVESGATISGLSHYLKNKLPNLKVIGVEPIDSILGDDSPVHTTSNSRIDWRIEDLGNHVVPSSLDKKAVDAWVKVSDKEAYSTARRLIRDQGILCGPSSGAVTAAAIQYAKQQPSENHSTHEYRSVVILNDSAQNYTSTLLNDEWIFENDLADEVMIKELEYLSYDRYRAASVEDLQLPAAMTITPSTTISRALDLMYEREYSQLPVVHANNKKLVGYVSLASLEARLNQGTSHPNDQVDSCMFSFKNAKSSGVAYQLITPDTSLADLAKFFEKNSFAVVTDVNRKWCLGVATKYDLISFLHRRQIL
ncbi:tryptophan synthase beta subunit-like PLP-dependent enzyme [Halteromyces radiatus]|uniref:tryptophan synthase beta subunit-like PLP-dependent enzyme n=1 Tax=Halteromyces radiatus TaxID=101107 RepID=UPI00221F277E|nr:tryptophan synthase beta subunit-like PLP-dependent enzyme [Halteromyces radiatus]KAI8090031.1 tryptophan synthase beta subunit-like PLP-dependent enzyme [Halteromyces radiatus]